MSLPENLTESFIQKRLEAAYRPGQVASFDRTPESWTPGPLKCAAVLMPLIRQREEWHLVFTRRTDTVEQHKGQVSFPGGGCDRTDANTETTALREAKEEIGLQPSDVQVLGRLNDVVTITGYRISPVVGVMPWPYPLKPEPAEVERVFTIPLAWLADRDHWDERIDPTRGPMRVIRYRVIDGELLWGISARIVQNFIVLLDASA